MAENSWESYKSCFESANDFIQQLHINPDNCALYDTLHKVIWHDGFDPVRWINGNHDLIERLSRYREITNLSDEIKEEIRVSLNKLIRK